MLEQLHRVTQAVSLAEGKQDTLNVIVSEVCKALDVQVCSIYLADYQLNQFVLMANRGFNPDYIGQVRLDFNQGLVGLIGQREEPIHLERASSHPAYSDISQVNEHDLNAFLGVPIIHRRKVLGVLVIQQKEPRQFSLDEETFLITLAAQLSAILSNSEINALLEDTESEHFSPSVYGNAASSGIAIGKAVVIFPPENIHSVPDRKTDNIQAELDKLGAAVKAVHLQLERMARRMSGRVSAQELSLFEAYQQILGSQGISEEVEAEINQGYWAATALRIVIQRHLKVFKSMQDPYLRERASDIEDLANRVLAQLFKANVDFQHIPENSIVVAENMSAAMIAELPPQHVAGIISLKGSITSHAAILAKALGVPAIMGMEHFAISRVENKTLIIDGYIGQVLISPNESLIAQYQQLIEEDQKLAADLAEDSNLPCQTRCGKAIALMINNSQGTDFDKARRLGAQGVGLFRSEIPFMQLQQFPSETAQTQIYRNLILEFQDAPVTIRTLDIGGDKQLAYFPIVEDNPFLGWRGVRVTLDHPEIFLVQLRAIFKACKGYSGIRIALPMVATLDELEECYRLIYQAFDEVNEELAEGETPLATPQIGIILEIPAAVFQLKTFLKRVDFISVGTNDLIQYMMAADRNNILLKGLYTHYQPAIICVLKNIIDTCQTTNVPVQVCGEMASDPIAAILLIGLGYTELSMNVSCLARVKRAISQFTIEEAQSLVKEISQFENAETIRNYLLKEMEERGLGGLVRAGN
ncbi:phosphoenolpyruvate--protein phosphotransferase [Aliikangiella sp. IMCC44653]